MAASTASASLSIVSTASAPSAAVAASVATAIPSDASGWAFPGVRFHARTWRPAPARLRAIAWPIVPPAPRTATERIAGAGMEGLRSGSAGARAAR